MSRMIPVAWDKAIPADPQRKFPAVRFDSPQTGPVTQHHADFIIVGETGNEDAMRICVTVGSRGCPCGCRADGIALMVTPSVEHARELAAQLIAIAEQHEAQAAATGAAALAKAAGK